MIQPETDGVCITSSGAHLAWWSVGAGDPLLLVSGQGVDASSWDPIRDTLAAHYRVISFDPRGVGTSTLGTTEAFSTRDLAADAVAVLDAAGVRRAHVYGHSMGGRVAQWIGIDFPDRVGALVLGATTAADAAGPARSPEAGSVLAAGKPMETARLFFTRRHLEAHPDAARAFLRRPAELRARRLHNAASRAHDTRATLRRLTAPVLLLHGDADEITPPQHSEILQNLIPDAVRIVLPGVRHGYFAEDPTATTIVLNFLAEHPLEKPGHARVPPAV